MKKKKLFVADFSRIMLMFFLVGFLYSCVKHDIRPPKPPSASDESADVVYAWYKFVARLQLRVSPQPVIILHNRNFGYIGVGLYEAVRPGIKRGSEFIFRTLPNAIYAGTANEQRLFVERHCQCCPWQYV